MEQLQNLLYKYLDKDLQKIVISNPRIRGEAAKISLRPVLLKGSLFFQATEYKDKKVYHKNLSKEEAAGQILQWMGSYRQLALCSKIGQATVLSSKKGKLSVKEKPASQHAHSLASGAPPAAVSCMEGSDLSHNRKKRYILDPEKNVPFLVDLGVQTQDGKIVHAKYDKFRQINRFLEFIADVLPQLPKDREITILDFGCGKSYLTFAMYYYLKELKGLQIRIVGLDLKEDVIADCNRLAEKYGYQDLEFLVGDIAGYEGVSQVDMVVTLHACDTATDYALDKAVRWGAKVILSVPCCQHELNGQIENALLAPVFKYGLIKERMSALFTDALRAQILESKGYQVQILEFIDMEHTPKNILIRAVKKGACSDGKGIREIMEFLHVAPSLYLLQDGKEEEQNA